MTNMNNMNERKEKYLSEFALMIQKETVSSWHEADEDIPKFIDFIESKILDTMLYTAVEAASGMSPAALILFIYLICLIMNFFIPSGSAKAFLLIPLIVPLARIFGISSQLSIVAFAFGDGFSNVFYPTNPVLLISLGLAGISYGRWAKFSFKFQFLNLILTSLILLFGLAVNYA